MELFSKCGHKDVTPFQGIPNKSTSRTGIRVDLCHPEEIRIIQYSYFSNRRSLVSALQLNHLAFQSLTKKRNLALEKIEVRRISSSG
jgi:hypothetical protein